MKLKLLHIIILAVLTVGVAVGQNEDELHIPDETDNQFPPDHSESDGLIEGSGAGVVEEPVTDSIMESTPDAKLEVVEPTITEQEEKEVETNPNATAEGLPCPKPCVCNTEGDTHNFIVDCSGYDLTEFPSPLDPRITTLKLHNNKLTEIPKEVSALKSLKVLNANNNEIMELSSGSVSELPELVTLKLANNRLIEYPKDLKNSLSLSKLEELDLGGNDIRTTLSPEFFSNFKALRHITLPKSPSELVLDLCGVYKETLETVCTESCTIKTFDCPDAPQNIEEDLLDATLPGMIPFNTGVAESNNNNDNNTTSQSSKEDTEHTHIEMGVPLKATIVSSENSPTGEFSLRTAVNSAPQEKIASNVIVETSKDEGNVNQTDVKVGAKTVDTKTGGVDKSVIGMIVAGMVVIVAGITIKKNWSSIKKKFSSTPRPNERTGETANGTTPEEVPLQDKSPV